MRFQRVSAPWASKGLQRCFRGYSGVISESFSQDSEGWFQEGNRGFQSGFNGVLGRLEGCVRRLLGPWVYEDSQGFKKVSEGLHDSFRVVSGPFKMGFRGVSVRLPS